MSRQLHNGRITVSSDQVEKQVTKTLVKTKQSKNSVLRTTQSIANPAQTANNLHISLFTTAKDTSGQIPWHVFGTKLKNKWSDQKYV